MIGYITIGTNDLAAATHFFDTLLVELGWKRIRQTDRLSSWASTSGPPALSVVAPYDGMPATGGNGTMIALQVSSPAAVSRMHALALTLGGENEGAPGLRGSQFYGGYFRDLDGNKLCFYCLSQ